MGNFELSRYITIGRYIKRDSYIHHLDPRMKIICFVLWVFGVSAFSSITIQLCLLIFTMLLFLLSKIPLRYGLSGIRPALPMLIVILLFEIVFARSQASSQVLWHAGWLQVTTAGIRLAVLSLTKLLSILWLVSLLTLTTSLSHMTHAVHRLLRPLKVFRVPVEDLVMVMTIALRFVPLLTEEAERLMKAQAARGADFGTARWWQIVKRTKSVLPIVIPLFVSALHRGEDLVMVMEVRGYRPSQTRSSYVEFHGRSTDALAVLASAVVIGCALWFSWVSPLP